MLRRAVEDGAAFGWGHTDKPSREDVLDAQVQAVMSELCDVLHLEGEP